MINSFSALRYVADFKKFFLGKEIYVITLEGYKIVVRPRTSDIYCIGEIIVNEEYLPSIKGVGSHFDTILDLGANIGCFSIWAARKLRPEKIISVEMEKSNYESLLKNITLNNLKRVVVPVRAAIYSKDTQIWIKTSAVVKSVDKLSETDTGVKVRTFSLKSLVDLYQINKIDYFKMDIEGSEKFVLTEENREIFRKRVKYLFMEAHHFLKNDPKASLQYFRDLGFEVKTKFQVRRPLAPYLIEAFNPVFKKNGF